MKLAAALTALVMSSTILVGTASAEPHQCPVVAPMQAADAYWVANGPDQASNSWQNATFHVGNLALVRTSGESNHKTLPWAQANKFGLQTDPKRPFFPDFEAAGEAYLDLYTYFHPDPPSLAALRQRVAEEVASVNQGHTSYWNYVDALNMAMPSFARLGVLDNSEADLAAMQKLFHYTEKQAGGHGLFDERTGFWWRDADFVGTNTYWSRGNGWAISALTKVLQALPATDPRRPEYVRVFTKMAAALKSVQRTDGFWNVNLGNPQDHPGPETSGTAFFTYGLAWGVNAGLLPAATYKPVVGKAWTALTTKALQPSGLLGYVQGVGAKPSDHQPVRATDTAAYGVGAFLLAGQQVAKSTTGC
ncbi:glycoside hydrolase family 88 protein [Kutzneria viridogrisea]|uniref:Rhamnogalacturonyl hydrolase YesR n=1 Tax=Kutzneria viridogrisea TaxID=47990 RepID=A0ABR6BNE5_9PSEU|nr:rhamnogalacturonyl hydrolase YesR [Kutzneria viridogrisea]